MSSRNQTRMMQIEDAVAREKSIDPRHVIGQWSRHRKADNVPATARDRRARRDRRQEGRVRAVGVTVVVDVLENFANQIRGRAKRQPGARSATHRDNPASRDYGPHRRAIRKKVIVRKVREASATVVQDQVNRIGDIVNGIVKRVKYGSVMVDSPAATHRRATRLRRVKCFRNGDRVRGL